MTKNETIRFFNIDWERDPVSYYSYSGAVDDVRIGFEIQEKKPDTIICWVAKADSSVRVSRSYETSSNFPLFRQCATVAITSAIMDVFSSDNMMDALLGEV